MLQEKRCIFRLRIRLKKCTAHDKNFRLNDILNASKKMGDLMVKMCLEMKKEDCEILS